MEKKINGFLLLQCFNTSFVQVFNTMPGIHTLHNSPHTLYTCMRHTEACYKELLYTHVHAWCFLHMEMLRFEHKMYPKEHYNNNFYVTNLKHSRNSFLGIHCCACINKKNIMNDMNESHFHLSGCFNKQICCNWGSKNSKHTMIIGLLCPFFRILMWTMFYLKKTVQLVTHLLPQSIYCVKC